MAWPPSSLSEWTDAPAHRALKDGATGRRRAELRWVIGLEAAAFADAMRISAEIFQAIEQGKVSLPVAKLSNIGQTVDLRLAELQPV
jgi:hypothetical protein